MIVLFMKLVARIFIICATRYTVLVAIDLVAQRKPSQVQSASSTCPTTGPHESDAQAPTLSEVRALVQNRQDQFRVATQTPTTRAIAFSTIDKDIYVFRELTRPLLSLRNSLAPISALPPELLSRIFRFHALADPAWSSDTRMLGWIAVTHVCQHWRQVALDDSSLWARISGFSWTTTWRTAVLVRVRNIPLVVDLACVPKPERLTELLPVIPHTRELRLRSLSHQYSTGVQDICTSEALELEHFELESSVASPVTFRPIAGTRLFKGRTPKLRTLSFAQVFIPWSLIPRGQLTQLKIILPRWIRRPPGVDLSPDDLNQLFDLLINSPQLEILTIEFCLPIMLSRVSQGQTIHLPRLSHLCLGGQTSSVTNLLKILTIPSSATLHLHCETTPTYNDHHILPLIAAHFDSTVPVTFKSLRITANHLERLLEVAASISPPKATIYNPYHVKIDMDNEIELTLSFDGLHEFGPSNEATILTQVCRMLPISNVEFLSISVVDTIPSVNWYDLFQHCTKVTTLQLRGAGTSGLLLSLAPPKPVNTQSNNKGKKKKGKRDNRAAQARVQTANNATDAPRVTTTATPFPKLSSLFLANLNFDIIVPYFGVLGDVLVNALRRRKIESQTPVKTLTVVNCVVSAGHMNGMKKHVEDFTEGISALPRVYLYLNWDDGLWP